MKLNAGCGTHYADGWVNVDVWANETTRPDVLVEQGVPYPFDDGTFDAVYLGHVLEHFPWPEVAGFLTDMRRVAKPGAPILIVGPDAFRTIKLWAAGKQPWDILYSVIEHQPADHHGWPGAAHHWNCHEDRLVEVLTMLDMPAERYSDLIPDMPDGREWHDPATGVIWPVVGKNNWQCAVLTRA